MKAVKARPTWIALLLLLAVVVPASAQPAPQSAATLRATGTFASNGSFAGTITINRFEQRGTQMVGAAGTPLGDLVCAASDLLGNVAGVVNLLNSLLGVVTGLLGGLTGGLAGIGG